jgi:drug/metabolite transporter (DMT)-like permease
VLLGSVLFLGYLLQTLGLVHTSASRSGVFTSLAVVFVPLLMVPLERRRPRGGVLLAVGLALGRHVLLDERRRALTRAMPPWWATC